MKQLGTVLVDTILHQCTENQCNLVRVEHFDTPLVYHALCQALEQNGKFAYFYPKITKEKYEEFQGHGDHFWASALEYFHQGENDAFSPTPDLDYQEKSFVDFQNAMTKWRNKAAEVDVPGTGLILLWGLKLPQTQAA
ncbi:MAG: hypothetical protein R3Y63_06860 [Eubacteriales bacterium]